MRINDPGLDMLAKYSGNFTSSPWEQFRTSSTSPLILKTQVPPRPDGRVGGKLQSLSIPGIRRQSRGGLVTFLQEIVQVHPNLRELEFSIPAPPSTSTKSIFSWSHILFPSLHHLTSLTIRDCEFLDDANLEPIAKHCGRLQHLILFNVVNMTEVSFTALVQSLTQLRSLVLRGARYLTDAHVAQLFHCECAPKLEKLDFTDCFELGDDTLYMLSTLRIVTPIPTPSTSPSTSEVQLVPMFSRLKHVAMENCRRLSFRGVLGLIKSLVNVKACPRWSKVVQTGSLVSLHVSGAWEGVTQKALVAYRERPGLPTVTREIHLATLAVRGLVRDEFDIGPIGSGGASMLWSILPNHQGRPPVPWFCRFARSSLKELACTYAWVPVPTRCQSLKPSSQLPSIPGILFTVSQVPGIYIAYQQSNPETQNQTQTRRPSQPSV
ncbi:hypothetical protein HMI54_005449 [Coelomomyces lativittatus]|nr:hypothetical protein HMI54_005449 [Coelomomyces lativittatus]